MEIIGAGMTGLLAAHYFRHKSPVVFERAAGPVDNHHALLRLRSDELGRITGAPLKRVKVYKGVFDQHGGIEDRCSLLAANCYSQKVIDFIQQRSILNLAPVERWVPEVDLMDWLRKGIDVKYGLMILPVAQDQHEDKMPYLSTAPLHQSQQWLSGPEEIEDFPAIDISVVTCELHGIDLHQTIYNPWPAMKTKTPEMQELSWIYRGSYVGNRLILEGRCYPSLEKWDSLSYSSIDTFNRLVLGRTTSINNRSIRTQKGGKLLPIDTAKRRHIVQRLTNELNVYSVGRFALWRNLVLDDVIGDLAKIKSMIEGGVYERALHYGRG